MDSKDFRGYDYCEDLHSSLIKLSLFFEIIKACGYNIGFSYDDLEKVVLQIQIFINAYTVPKNKLGDLLPSKYTNISSPLFTITELISNDIYLDKDIVNRIFDILSISIEEIKDDDVYGVIKVDNKYCMVYFDYFVAGLYEKLEHFVINNGIDKDKYYKFRGKYFERLLNETFKSELKNIQIYKNTNYYLSDEKNEIDLLILNENNIIIVECKSSNYNEPINLMEINDSLYKGLKNSFGRGFKTLDKAYYYFRTGSVIEIHKNDEIVKIDTANKEIYTLMISLKSIKSISGNLSKIIKDKNINHIPLVICYSDLLTILKNTNDIQKICYYLKQRDYILNSLSNVTFDLDEVDAYGIITSNQYERLIDSIKIMRNIDLSYYTTNSAYRKEANFEINNLVLNYLINKYTNWNSENYGGNK